MPLSKAKDAERKRIQRLNVQPASNLNDINPVQPKRVIPGLVIEGNRILGITPVKPPDPEYVPWYDPLKHKVGDKVRIRDNRGRVQVVVIPELDADGRSVYITS